MKQDRITGFHHLTAMAGDVAANIHFYTKVLGMRMVKITVNYDDPTVYHTYFADQLGSPGSVITFFPWGSAAAAGEKGRGEISGFTLRVPEGSLPAWQERLAKARVAFEKVARPEGDVLELHDDSNHKLRLWAHGEPLSADKVVVDSPVLADEQVVEFVGVEFTVGEAAGTKGLLGAMGMLEGAGNRFGFDGDSVRHIDVLERPDLPRMRFGAASVHHLAFRVADDEDEVHWQGKLMAAGYGVTEVKDRQYFNSVYMREPGGIVLELATMAPGFAIDEPVESLGTTLTLPAQYEPHRKEIVGMLKLLPMIDYGL